MMIGYSIILYHKLSMEVIFVEHLPSQIFQVIKLKIV